MDDDHVSRADEKRFLKRLEQAALHEHPNPERIGCPGPEFLKQLAESHRSVPIDDPRIDHIGECSPCFLEFSELRAARRRRRRLLTAGPIAAVVIILAVLLTQQRPSPPATTIPPPGVEVAKAQPATLDFRPFATTRDTDPSRARTEVPTVERGVLDTRVLLPVGTEPGRYELRIMDKEDFRIFLRKDVQAEIENGLTAITTQLDLTKLPPGRYTLGIRLGDGDWRTFPLQVR